MAIRNLRIPQEINNIKCITERIDQLKAVDLQIQCAKLVKGRVTSWKGYPRHANKEWALRLQSILDQHQD